MIEVYENGDGPLVYPVTLKDGTYIGYVQAVPFDDGTWEVGYHIGENFTKQGYETEAVTEFLPKYVYYLSPKDIVVKFFEDGYTNKNYDFAFSILYDGINIGTCMGIPATGKHITFEALENFKVENGKITESWGYWPDKEIEQKLKEEKLR